METQKQKTQNKKPQLSPEERIAAKIKGITRIVEENPRTARLVIAELPEAFTLSHMVDEVNYGLRDLKLAMGSRISYEDGIEIIENVVHAKNSVVEAVSNLNRSGYGTRRSVLAAKTEVQQNDKRIARAINSEDAELSKLATSYQKVLEKREADYEKLMKARIKEDKERLEKAAEEDESFKSAVHEHEMNVQEEARKKKDAEKQEKKKAHEARLKQQQDDKKERLAQKEKKETEAALKKPAASDSEKPSSKKEEATT